VLASRPRKSSSVSTNTRGMEGTIDLVGAMESGTSYLKRPIQRLPSKVGFVLRMGKLELESSLMRIMIDKINVLPLSLVRLCFHIICGVPPFLIISHIDLSVHKLYGEMAERSKAPD
jgi:hypothetical protein